MLADYTQFRNSFFTSGGLFSSNVSVDLTASFQGKQIGGNANATGKINGTAQFKNKTAPIFSLEYQGRILRNFLLPAEVGVISVGGASLSTSPYGHFTGCY